MTDQEKRVRIAEAAGWVFHPEDFDIWTSPDGEEHAQPPDYLTDLNAIADAEWVVLTTVPLLFKYRDLLQKLVNPKEEAAINPGMFTFGANAAQRSEAMLRVLEAQP